MRQKGEAKGEAKGDAALFSFSRLLRTRRMINESLKLYLLVMLMGTALVCFFMAFYLTIVATINRKPGVPYFPRGEDHHVLFRPDQLTSARLKARKSRFNCLAVMLGAFLLMVLLSFI